MSKDVSSQLTDKTGSDFNVLGDVLNTLRFRGSIFFRSQLASPWGMSLGKFESPRFHIALNGNFFLGSEDNDKQVVNIDYMDIVLLPHGESHWIADQPDRELTQSQHAVEACELGAPLFQQGDITNQIMCGLVHFDKELLHPVISSLPSVLHFTNIKVDDPIWMSVMLIDAEMKETYASQTSIIDRLTEILFLQLLNKYVNENKDATGFFAAIRDRRIRRLLELIHQEPELQWTLEMLGKRAGMSRATLARQFKNEIDVSPMTYLTNWRMIKAYHLLKYSSQSLDEIAEMVGFSTARTLTKAFQRHFGYTPSDLRLNPRS